MADIKYELRKIGFPQCVKEALMVLEKIFRSQVIGPSVQLANEIVAEFIFCKRIPSSNKSKPATRPLNRLEELELLEILCSYFSAGTYAGPYSDAALRNSVFFCIFPNRDTFRAPTLVKLVSMVIASRSTSLLSVAGKWLQIEGPTSETALAMASSIVKDYLILVPEAKKYLADMPLIAPEFTSCFLCSVAQLYGDRNHLPPKALLETVNACTKGSLYLSTTVFAVNHGSVTPFIGLARWCILAPVYGAQESEHYAQLHLALLESLVNKPKENLVSVEQLATFVTEILECVNRSTPAQIDKTLERFTQTLIVLLRTGMVAGNILDLFQQIDKLPRNEFLDKVSTCRQTLLVTPLFRLPH